MTLRELLERLELSPFRGDLRIELRRGPVDLEIKGIAYDSRAVRRDYLFVSIRGFSRDGHNYINEAISRGATAVLTENAVEKGLLTDIASHERIAHVVTTHSRKALAHLSAAFYGEPSQELGLIGITGTNGKTTTSYITRSIIEEWGRAVGLIGTIDYIIGNKTIKAHHTTPESLDLQRYLREMVDNGIEYSVLEVSSHALTLERVECCSFRVAAFTSFSQDHLDFHGGMEDYFNAKKRLFDYLRRDGLAVLNVDDPRIRGLADSLGCDVITCGFENGAMIRATNIRSNGSGKGLRFEIHTPDSGYEVETRLYGRFNVYNILISVGIAHVLGIEKEAVQRGISHAMSVPGRFEVIDEGQDFLCVVDYAHTEDALRNLIQEARHLTKGRIITVFGCGGNRDRTKRPLMGVVASEMSDVVIITSDNPRDEEPMDIIRDIVEGMKRDNYMIEPDRAKAIRKAVAIAEGGDTVLIAGKGHEDYQEIKRVKVHFDDREVLRMVLRERKRER
jgi:UDP-N-acetylmuramoyl-L-alanyl-D-glutamate--2,6-diaminopimelate ligase